MPRFETLIHRSAIALVLLGQPVLITRGLAQSAQEQCDALATEWKALKNAQRSAPERYYNAVDAFTVARGRLEALEGVAGTPNVLSGLMMEEGFSAAGMRRFREQHLLPASLDAPIAAARPAEFWRGAKAELHRRMTDVSERYGTERDRISTRLAQILAQRQSLDCDRIAANTGPLPIQRNPSGLPIITDALLTRWFRAYRAMQSGGAYWRPGQMTQQDFTEVNGRIVVFTDAACRPEGARTADGRREWICPIDPVRTRLEQAFAAEELAVFEARRSDMEAALSGNWSAVRM